MSNLPVNAVKADNRKCVRLLWYQNHSNFQYDSITCCFSLVILNFLIWYLFGGLLRLTMFYTMLKIEFYRLLLMFHEI
jgi:hypothetical protein